MSEAANFASTIHERLATLSHLVYEENKAKGFWPANHKAGEKTCIQPIKVRDGEREFPALAELPSRNVGEQLMLVVTEISEALETFRKNGFEGKSNVLPEVPHFAEEIADAVIRILDLDGGFQLGVWEALAAKLEYNATRPHKHGKRL